MNQKILLTRKFYRAELVMFAHMKLMKKTQSFSTRACRNQQSALVVHAYCVAVDNYSPLVAGAGISTLVFAYITTVNVTERDANR